MNRLRLVTFDVTETLLNFRVPPPIKYAEVGAAFGIKVNPSNVSANFRKQYKYMASNHPIFGRHTIGWETWWRDLVISTFQLSVKDEIDKKTLNDIGNNLIELYKTPEVWSVAEGCQELLASLNKKDINLGVISNFDERLETILKAMKLHQYFKFVITSYTSGYEKPDSHIFQLALSKLELKSNDALHVGNTPETDYMGALNAGWNAALVHQDAKKISEKYPDINPQHVFPTLRDLQLCLI